MSFDGYFKTIVCFANTRRHSGRCISGLEYEDGQFGDWIRPVSVRPTREISEEERRYENGTYPRVGDIIRIPLNEPCPCDYQSENHLIHPGYYWEKTGEISWEELQPAIETVNGPLWVNGSYDRKWCLTD